MNNLEDRIKVIFEPVHDLNEDFIVWFERSDRERRIAGVADLRKIRQDLLNVSQMQKLELNEVNVFSIPVKNLLFAFEDVYL